jgi:hypothetical protein
MNPQDKSNFTIGTSTRNTLLFSPMRRGLTFLVSSTVTIIEFGPHSIKIGGLVVKSGGRIIGQIFFNETTNAQRFQRLLGPFVNELDCVELTNGYFRQDSATPHMPQTTIHY